MTNEHKGWRSLRDALRKATAAFSAFALTACATAPADPVPAAATAEAPRPALWKLSDADTDIYLFGTIHILPAGFEWRTPAIDAALAESDELVLETVLGDDPAKSAQAMMAKGMSPNNPPILDRVPADRRAALQQLMTSTGVPAAALDRMDTWAAALILFTTQFQKMGLTGKSGVETALQGAAGTKPVSGLETIEQQFGFFDNLSEESQRLFLVATIDDSIDVREQFEKMIAAWASGDTDAIAATFDAPASMSPELREVLMTRRNAAWAEWIAKRMERPGTVMVAVGAGHLAGRDSVQAMLAAKGLRVERVQ